IAAGTSGPTEPSWNATLGAATSDTAPLIWQCAGYSGYLSTPVDGPSYFDGGDGQVVRITPAANNILDTSRFAYVVGILDESGQGAQAGNIYQSIQLDMVDIGDMRLE